MLLNAQTCSVFRSTVLLCFVRELRLKAFFLLRAFDFLVFFCLEEHVRGCSCFESFESRGFSVSVFSVVCQRACLCRAERRITGRVWRGSQTQQQRETWAGLGPGGMYTIKTATSLSFHWPSSISAQPPIGPGVAPQAYCVILQLKGWSGWRLWNSR